MSSKRRSLQLVSLPGLEVGFILDRLRVIGLLDEYQASAAVVGLFGRGVLLGLGPYANLLGRELNKREQGTSTTHLVVVIHARTARGSDRTHCHCIAAMCSLTD